MQIKSYPPITSSLRHHKNIKKNLLIKNDKIIKKLIFSIRRNFNRSSLFGHITISNKSCGAKYLYRRLDSTNEKNKLGILLFSSYDPNRNSFISLNFDLLQNTFFYILGTKNVSSGSIIGLNLDKLKLIHLGFQTFLKNMPHGIAFHSLSFCRNKKQYAKAAGTYCHLIDCRENICFVRLPSGKLIKILGTSIGIIGVVSNSKHKFISLGKAGRARLNGFRPHVRGIAKNPVDHPHGGRTNGGCSPKTPWGKPTLGKKTKKLNKKNLHIKN
jgi:large subunit ribosomal protein L2